VDDRIVREAGVQKFPGLAGIQGAEYLARTVFVWVRISNARINDLVVPGIDGHEGIGDGIFGSDYGRNFRPGLGTIKRFKEAAPGAGIDRFVINRVDDQFLDGVDRGRPVVALEPGAHRPPGVASIDRFVDPFDVTTDRKSVV
jgi:hypothetical protein